MDFPNAGLAYGSMFVGTVVKTLTRSTSPLLKEVKKTRRYLQPDNPTETQTEAYDEFQMTILELLSTETSRRPYDLETILRARDEEEVSGSDRPFSKNSPHNPHVVNPDDPDPSRPSYLTDLNLPTTTDVRKLMRTKATVLARSCRDCRGFCQHCFPFPRKLKSFVRDEGRTPDDGPVERHIVFSIHFRLDAARFVNAMVEAHRLPRPFGYSCFYWHLMFWSDCRGKRSQRYLDLKQLLSKVGIRWRGHEEQAPGFAQAWVYLLAALYDSDNDMETCRSIVGAIKEDAKKIVEVHQKRLFKEPRFQEAARKWLGSIGEEVNEDLWGPVQELRE